MASNYLYDGLNIVAETNSGTTYLNGRGIDEHLAMQTGSGATAQTDSYLTDALGSTIRLTDGNGNKLVDYTYSLYGATTADAADANPFQYTGRENDGTGLYYYRNRYYSTALQRFISQDPSGLNGGINMYGYVNGNPLGFTDPLGLAPAGPDYATTSRFGHVPKGPLQPAADTECMRNYIRDNYGPGTLKAVGIFSPSSFLGGPLDISDDSPMRHSFVGARRKLTI